MLRVALAILILLVNASAVVASDRATITGEVRDGSGHSLAAASVMIYEAFPRIGASSLCLTCYSDCGKKASTGEDGSFYISGVDTDMLFNLLVTRQGLQPQFIRNVDSLSKVIASARLVAGVAPNDEADRIVRGHVTDEHGVPLRDVVVRPIVLRMHEVSEFFQLEGVAPMAVTNSTGDFELRSQRSASGMMLNIQARGFAPKFEALSTGFDRQTIAVRPGTTIQGRLVNGEVPIAGAWVGLIPRNRGSFSEKLIVLGDPYSEFRVGTRQDGSFTLVNVPGGVDWYLYVEMGSLSNGLAARPIEFRSGLPGTVVNIGDLKAEPGHTVNGKLVLPEGIEMHPGMYVVLKAELTQDHQVAEIRSDGEFEFKGLTPGNYEIEPSVQDYPSRANAREFSVSDDLRDLVLDLTLTRSNR